MPAQHCADALAEIRHALGDCHSGETHVIDPNLLEYLVEAAAVLGAEARFTVISGYRSPPADQKLPSSLRMHGRAIDVRLPGMDCAELASRSADLNRGGVGYHRAANFVHLDTGAVRTWRG